jgi:hypothetical protein
MAQKQILRGEVPPPPLQAAQFMNGLTALGAKTKAGAPCDVSNTPKRGGALVKAGASRAVRPHKGPTSQKPAVPPQAWPSGEAEAAAL